MCIKIISVIFAIFGGCSAAWSQGTLSWQFDTTAFVVQPTDQILLTGTISNSSLTPYLIEGGGAIFTGDLQSYYQLGWVLDFRGKTVPANGVLEFGLCTLTPIGGYVQLGTYQADPLSDPAAIGVNESDWIYTDYSLQITVVPEPSNFYLFGSGLAILFMSRLPKHKSLIN